ncbi:MAG: tail fiber domain-containing protein [Bacteroidota bacterium]
MIVITSISPDYFEINGDRFPTIYQPLRFGTSSVGIYNVFDTRFQLLSHNLYDEFEVDGSVYATVDDLIEALLPVMYKPIGVSTSLFWGNVLGNINNQSDLIDLLDQKVDTNHTHTTSEISNISAYTGFDARYYTKSQGDVRYLQDAPQDGVQYVRLNGGWSAVNVNSTSALWGQINGDIALQSDLQGLLSGKADLSHTHLASDITDLANYTGFDVRYVPLNAQNQIDSNYLPSFVDDILEFADLAAFPATGETGKLYVAIDSNLAYRWTGTQYIGVGGSGSGNVDSVFGRVGPIVAEAGDYAAYYIRKDVADTKTAGALKFNDDVQAQFGTDADVQFNFNGTDFFVNSESTGGLFHYRRGGVNQVTIDPSNGNITAQGIVNANQLILTKGDGAVYELGYEDNYLRWRRGGGGSNVGWRWDNFDTAAMLLTAGGDLTISNDLYLQGGQIVGDSKQIILFSDAWLRINQSSAFSSGTYFGSSIVRSDNQFQIGTAGGNFYANNAGDVRISGAYMRTTHNTGYLEGSYNNVGANAVNTNPIYIIGSNYQPNSTTLGNMYGIGYAADTASYLNSTDLGTTPSSGWGMYVASDGNARIFLNASNGNIRALGQVYCSNAIVRGRVQVPSTSSRSKLSVYGDGSTYAIGMQSGRTHGNLNDWAMTFQMNSESDRGWLWCDTSHTTAAGGAMSLSTDGYLNVANHLRIGYGESDTSNASTTYTIQANGTMQATNFILSSDRRLKKNIKNYEAEAIDVQWRVFDWKNGDKNQIGVIAQEILDTHPQFVSKDDNGMLSVKYTDLLIAKVAEQDHRIKALEQLLMIG